MGDIPPQVEAQKRAMPVLHIAPPQVEHCMLSERKMTIRLLYDLIAEFIVEVQVIQL